MTITSNPRAQALSGDQFNPNRRDTIPSRKNARWDLSRRV